MTALRQLTLSSGATVWARAAYRMNPLFGLYAVCLSLSFVRIWVRAWVDTPLWLASRSAVPAIRRESMSSAFVVIVRMILSTSCLRFGSEAGSQFGFLTSTAPVSGLMLSNLYGPEEAGASAYFSPVSRFCGTGAPIGIEISYGKFAFGAASLKMIVESSGVSTDFRPILFGSLSLYGPGYFWPWSRSWTAYSGPFG